MRTSGQDRQFTVALVGNPNTGKSTLFTALVGIHQRVGNYPGVTVEKKTGRLEYGARRYEVVDLPGLYSLAPRSRDEMVAVDLLLGRGQDSAPVDAVICIVDASNLERNLYVVSQVLELRLPTVLALNMVDVAHAQGVSIDVARLAEQLGIPVVAIQANRRVGIAELKAALDRVIGCAALPAVSLFPQVFQREIEQLEAQSLGEAWCAKANRSLPRYLIERLLLDTGGTLRSLLGLGADRGLAAALDAARARLAEAGCCVPDVETEVRYDWVRNVLAGAVNRPDRYPETFSDRLDRLLTHRVWGMIVFLAVMTVVFQSVFVGAEPLIDGIDAGMKALGRLIEDHMAEGALRSLLVQGVIHGAGGVLVFLPQIMILFVFIALLEDFGYMARAAYLMDRWMARVGLSGKSFIPMLSSFACAVPGIMSARVIENERDRLATILVAPLMTCSARLPVYTMLIAAFIPGRVFLGGLVNLRGLTLAAMYLLGIVTAVAAVLVFKRTLLRGQSPPFVMELPSYKVPSLRTVVYRVVERAWVFVYTAGTVILAVSIVIWAALYYPHDAQTVEAPFQAEKERLTQQLAARAPDSPQQAAAAGQLRRIEAEIAAAYQRQSLLGRLGQWIEPVFRPLGWDWRIGSAVIASFPARETVIATLGVIFQSGHEAEPQPNPEETLTQLQASLARARWNGTDRPLFNVPVALSMMVFFALCAQCAATLAVIRRETFSWRWPVFTFTYMTTLAYLGAMLTYQIGMRIPCSGP